MRALKLFALAQCKFYQMPLDLAMAAYLFEVSSAPVVMSPPMAHCVVLDTHDMSQ